MTTVFPVPLSLPTVCEPQVIRPGVFGATCYSQSEPLYLRMELLTAENARNWARYQEFTQWIANAHTSGILGRLVDLAGTDAYPSHDTIREHTGFTTQEEHDAFLAKAIQQKKTSAKIVKLLEKNSVGSSAMYTVHTPGKLHFIVYITKNPKFSLPYVETKDRTLKNCLSAYSDLLISMGTDCTKESTFHNRGISRNPRWVFEGKYGGLSMLLHGFTGAVAAKYFPEKRVMEVRPVGSMQCIIQKACRPGEVMVENYDGTKTDITELMCSADSPEYQTDIIKVSALTRIYREAITSLHKWFVSRETYQAFHQTRANSLVGSFLPREDQHHLRVVDSGWAHAHLVNDFLSLITIEPNFAAHIIKPQIYELVKTVPGQQLLKRFVKMGRAFRIVSHTDTATFCNLNLIKIAADKPYFYVTQREGEKYLVEAPKCIRLAHELIHLLHAYEDPAAEQRRGQAYTQDGTTDEEERLTILGSNQAERDDCCENRFLAALGLPLRINHDGPLNLPPTLIDIIKVGALGTLKTRLKNDPSQINSVGANKEASATTSLLSAAAFYNHLDIITFLLALNVDVNAADEIGGPILAALKHDHKELALDLAKRGLNTQLKDESGMTALGLLHSRPTARFDTRSKPLIEWLEAEETCTK